MGIWELSGTALIKWVVILSCIWSATYAGFHAMGNWVDNCPPFLYNWAWRSSTMKEREANCILDSPHLPLMYRQEVMILVHLMGGIPILVMLIMVLGPWWGSAFLGALVLDIVTTTMIIRAVGRRVEQIRWLRLSQTE